MPATRFKPAIFAVGLLFMLADAHADDDCPPPTSAIAKAPAPDSADSQADATANPADIPITIESDDDNFQFDVDGNARLCGNVVMRQGDRTLKADCLQYDAAEQSAKMDGGVEFSDPKLTVRGNSGEYSPILGTSFQGAEFELLDRGARGSAESLQVGADGKVKLNNGFFTTCPASDQAWQITARQIEIDTRERVGRSRGAKVEFKGVPLLYLPYLSFPLETRKTGFLFPDFGHSSRSGAQLTTPFYWNIRPNADFTAMPTWYSKRGVDLGGEFRFLTARQRGSLSFNYLPDDSLANRDRTRVALAHVAELPGEWRFRIDAVDVGDTQYFEDFAQGPEGTSVAFAERLAEATYRDEHVNVRAQFQHFQTIDDELPDEDRPYARTPRVLASGDWDLGLGAVDYGFDAELVNFDRNVGTTGWRMDIAPRAGFDWSAPGFFVRPSAGYRYTQYSLEDVAPGTDDSPTRSLPFASIDAGLVFERLSGSQKQRRLTLEPRALYLYTPYRDQSQLPLFDTGIPDLNLVQLYRNNRYVGADRVNDANQLAFGLTSRLFDGRSGAQYLAVSVGQAYYFDKPRVVLPNETPSTRDFSDFIAQVSLTAYKDWNLEAGIQWNPEDTRSERSQFRLQYRPADDKVVNLGYRAIYDRVEQGEFSTHWPIGKKWNAFGRAVYSLRDSAFLDQFAGFEYKACCYRFGIVARRFVSSRTGEKDTGIYLQLELNGLPGVNAGTDVDAFLQRTIRGYSPDSEVR